MAQFKERVARRQMLPPWNQFYQPEEVIQGQYTMSTYLLNNKLGAHVPTGLWFENTFSNLDMIQSVTEISPRFSSQFSFSRGG